MKKWMICIITALTLLFAIGCDGKKTENPAPSDGSEITGEKDPEQGSSEDETPEDENGGTWTEDVLLPSADNK